MTGPTAGLLLITGAITLTVLQLGFVAASWDHAAANAWYARPFAAATVLVSLVFVATGLLVARHRAGNAVGWLLAVVGVAMLLYQAASEYAVYGVLVAPGALPAPGVAAVLSQTLWIVPFATVPILLLRFPDGQLPSPRWRWGVVAALSAIALLVGAGTAVFWRYRHDGDALLVVDAPLVHPVAGIIVWSAVALVLAALAIAAGSLVVRWRRSRGVERLQLKWLLLSAMILCVHGATLFVSDGGAWTEVLLLGGLLSVPAAIAVAVTRYRLYEIDRVLSRTVSYLCLTLLLVGVYAAGVLGIGALVGSVTGGTGGDLVVALSTLVVAALFLPLRRRIHATMDRHFNRARYDAGRTVESFAARLRDELDLDMLEAELQRVISATLQPAWSAAWIPLRTDPPALQIDARAGSRDQHPIGRAVDVPRAGFEPATHRF